MALQKHHKAGKMVNGADRKMTVEEFNLLMNNAYHFLNEICPPEVAHGIFTETDKDKDGLITYVEYFQIIDQYICKGASEAKGEAPPVAAVAVVEPPKPVDLGPERNSKLRIYIWAQLRKLYELYVQGRSLSANDV